MVTILEHSFNFNGFNCYVVRRHMGASRVYRCGYVQLSRHIDIAIAGIDCHGGITYASLEPPSPLAINDADKWYIGFDCAHPFDITDYWTVDRVSDELRHIVEQILSKEKARDNMAKLRVWHNCQVGAVGNFYVEVESIEQAWKTLNTLWDYDSFQYENNIKPDYCNASGLEYFDEEEQEWCEWYDDDGLDIKEHFEENEE